MVTYHYGDLLDSDCQIICHQVNCLGYMGAGIAKTIRIKYPNAYKVYREHYSKCNILGKVAIASNTDKQFPNVNNPRFIANMFAQKDIYPRGIQHTDYDAFRACLQYLKDELYLFDEVYGKMKIGFPDHIGCGLAGGNWDIIRSMIEEVFANDEHEIQIWKLN